jgi:hypothetical protein
MSTYTILKASLSARPFTLLTKEVFPIRRGEIKMEFTPFSKFRRRRCVSISLSVKCSPSTDIPKTKGLFVILMQFGNAEAKITNYSLCSPSGVTPSGEHYNYLTKSLV